MENDKTINPELVKWCAERTIPHWEWFIYEHPQLGGVCRKLAHSPRGQYFNPLTSADDQVALQMALMEKENGQWHFYKAISTEYIATSDSVYATQRSESFPLLLLSVASAQSGIPMYVGGGKCE